MHSRFLRASEHENPAVSAWLPYAVGAVALGVAGYFLMRPSVPVAPALQILSLSLCSPDGGCATRNVQLPLEAVVQMALGEIQAHRAAGGPLSLQLKTYEIRDARTGFLLASGSI